MNPLHTQQKQVFSLVDSLPYISPDDGAAIDWPDFRGGFELKNVEFFYSMRPDHKVFFRRSSSSNVC